MKHLVPGAMNLIIDLQWGSTGKGKIARYLYETESVQAAVCNFSPNSAHTSVEDDGERNVVKQLPQAAALVQKGFPIELFIGADACINPEVLEKELEVYPEAAKRLLVHPLAAVITPACQKYEQEQLVRISSTLQGTSMARAMKTMRHPETVLARDWPAFSQFVRKDFDFKLQWHLEQRHVVLGELHQGFELSINQPFYPYCTSSIVNTSQFLASLNLPPGVLGTVVGALRTLPIRVGNVVHGDGTVVGYSGAVYPDQRELSWDEVTEMAGAPQPLEEFTTLTKKKRRIFTFSMEAIKNAAWVNSAGPLFVNFVNYLDHRIYGQSGGAEVLTDFPKVAEFVSSLRAHNLRPAWLGTGEKNKHLIKLT